MLQKPQNAAHVRNTAAFIIVQAVRFVDCHCPPPQEQQVQPM